MIEYIVYTYDGNVIITLICTDICCFVKGGMPIVILMCEALGCSPMTTALFPPIQVLWRFKVSPESSTATGFSDKTLLCNIC